jgi:hypothetical protein
MTDELDPQLARWFAHAEQDLADSEFGARVAAAERRRHALHAPWRIGILVWRGLRIAVAGPLRLGPGFAGLAATAAIAITLGLVLQS